MATDADRARRKARKANRKARREGQRLAEAARSEAALGRACPRCKSRPGVWCGPVFDGPVFHAITPWMHQIRYDPTDQKDS